MKIAVIGSSGRSGRAFVMAALAAGHSVTAGTYHAQVAIAATNRLNIKLCDATDLHEVRALIEGQDAVVSLLGHVRGSAADVQTRAIRTIIKAMQECGMRRLVSLTGTGVRFPKDNISFADAVLNTAVKIADPKRIKDGVRHTELIRRSHLDWTIIRVMKLQDFSPKPFTLTEHGPGKIIVSRQEVAQAIVQVLEQNSFLQQAPIISSVQYKR